MRSATPMRAEGRLAFGQRVTGIIRRCAVAVRNARASSFGARNCGGLGPNASPTRRTLGDFYVSVLCCFCCDIELAKLRRVAAISIRCAGVVPRRVMLVVAAA